MKLTFFCVAPPKSRMVRPLVSRIWVKNSSSPRLGRTERVTAPALPFIGFLPPGGAGGPPPACPPRDPRKNPLSGSSMTKKAFKLTLHLCDACRPRGIRHGGLRRRNGRLLLGRRHLDGLRLHDVDTALEIRAILDDDTRRADIPGQLGILTDLNLLRGLHVSLNIAECYYFARLDGRANGPVRPDRELVLKGFHGAFHFAIDVQIFTTENLANYFDGLPYGGRTSTRLSLDSGRGHAGHG